MTDPRFNDMSWKLRRLAAELDAIAAHHRQLADQLDHALGRRIAAEAPPLHVVALDRAASELVHLPAEAIRRAAPEVARAHGLQVLPVALRAASLRAEDRAEARRKAMLTVVQMLAGGLRLRDAAAAAGVSVATARRLRTDWHRGRF